MAKKSFNRIHIPKFTELNEYESKIYNSIKQGKRGEVPDLFMVLMHSPEIAKHTQELGAKLRYETSLPPRLSELAILIIAKFWHCPYEWYYHEPEALKAGLEIKYINAIKEGTTPDFEGKEEAAIYGYTSELLYNRRVADETYQNTIQTFGNKAIVELTSLIGYYSMIAMTLNEHHVPIPNNAKPAI